VAPLVGRVFSPGDTTGTDATAVVLGYELWQSRFGGAADVLGRGVNLNGEPYEVIGVMPEDFRFPSRSVQLWMPLVFDEGDFLDRTDNDLEVVGRLRDGATLEAARAEMALVAGRLARDYPRENAETGANLLSLRDELPSTARLLLLGLCGASVCILLLACANLANLLLARAAGRARELAVRAALGAGRERLVRQLFTEGVTLAVLGGLAGVLVAVLVVPVLGRLVPTSLPIAEQPGVDLRVLGLAGLFTALTGIGFGVIPALRVGGRSGFGALREGARSGGGRRQRLRAALVAVQVAASVALLVSTGLLVRAVWLVQSTDPGFRSASALTLRTDLPMPKYADPERRDQFYARVLDEVRALPGVEHAAYISYLPMVQTGGIWPVGLSGREMVREAGNSASLRFVTPGFFTTMGIPLRRGRDVARSDTFDQPFVAVVSESFAERYWPGDDPIGRRFEFGFFERTIVGVVGDIRVRGLERPSEPQVYLPHRQVPAGGLIGYVPKDLVVRSAASAGALLPALRDIVRSVDPEQPISDVRWLDDIVAGQTAPRRAQLRVLGALAVVALMLAGVGIYGLLAFTVSQRSQEIGVRLALGARPAGIARMIVREGLWLAALGIVPGVILAFASARAMRALLVGISPGDPLTIALAVVVALLMTLVGALLPALRAVRVSPMVAMRAE
jgi:predicted permease